MKNKCNTQRLNDKQTKPCTQDCITPPITPIVSP